MSLLIPFRGVDYNLRDPFSHIVFSSIQIQYAPHEYDGTFLLPFSEFLWEI